MDVPRERLQRLPARLYVRVDDVHLDLRTCSFPFPSDEPYPTPQLGLIFPLVLVQWLGAAIACPAAGEVPAMAAWADAYATDQLGGLIGAALIPIVGNFGRFLMVLLVLSVIANNIISCVVPFPSARRVGC